MLLPGAGIFLSAIATAVILAVCIVLACIGGIIIHQIVPPLVRKTRQARLYWSGHKNAYRWYLGDNNWFFIGFWISLATAVYCAFGPWLWVINKLN